MKTLEIKRLSRVTDQMLSAHSILRDRYKRRAFVLSFGLIAVSIAICTFTFSGGRVFELLGFDSELSKLLIGLISTLLLIMSVGEVMLNWREVAEKHSLACRSLSTFKQDLRRYVADDKEISERKEKQLSDEYNKVNSSIVPIPDSEFASLKAKHLFKIELSKAISKNPKTPLFVTRFILWRQGIREFSKEQADAGTKEVVSKNHTDEDKIN